MAAVDQSKARRRGGAGSVKAREQYSTADELSSASPLTLHCAAGTFATMGMGSPENRP